MERHCVVRDRLWLAYSIWLLLLFSLPALAKVESPLTSLPCRKQISHFLDAWELHRTWRRELASVNGDTAYRAPTREIGVWLELHRSILGDIKAMRMSSEKVEIASWDGNRCTASVDTIAYRLDPKRMENTFTDEDFRRLVRTGTAGVIYAWSPHMPLSIRSGEYIRQAARKYGLRVVVVLDSDADDTLAREMVRRHGWNPVTLRRMQSIELFQRGMSIHFPSVLVFSGGKIRGDIIPGAKQASVYEKLIGLELAKR